MARPWCDGTCLGAALFLWWCFCVVLASGYDEMYGNDRLSPILRIRKSHIKRSEETDLEPLFPETIANVTVAVGRDAKLTCLVDRLGTFRVAWLRVESKTILTIHRHVITRNYRITLSHSDKNWVLHIKNVQEADRGGYMCQVNTVPMKSQVGFLDVVVPPDIVDTESSSDVLVREGSNVTLTCRAKGYPTPTLTWRREDSQAVAVGNWQSNKVQGKDTTYEGEELSITKVSRLHMGAYLCIASNNVPPSVSRRILLQVHFPPMIWIPNQLIGAPLGGEITIDCHTEAYPKSINYWTKEEGDMIISNDKYTASMKDKTYKVHMKLAIRALAHDDFGTYKCFAKNSLGSTEGSIRLYEIHVSPQPVKEPSTAKIQSMDGTSEEDEEHINIMVLKGSAVRSKDGKYEMSDDTLAKEQNSRARPPYSAEESNASDDCVRLAPNIVTLVVFVVYSIAKTCSLLPGT